MNIQRKNSAQHFRMQSEREQTLVGFTSPIYRLWGKQALPQVADVGKNL